MTNRAAGGAPAPVEAATHAQERAVRLAPSRAMALVVALLAAALLAAWPGVAHAAPQADAPTLESPDPAGITFRVKVRTEVDLASAVLNYKVLNPEGNIGGSVRADVPGGKTPDLSVRLPTNNAERYIPTGTQFVYSWTLTDKAGAAYTTPDQSAVFLDGRYQWSSRTQGNVTSYWYGADDTNGLRALEAAAGSIADNEALFGVKITYPIRVVVWRNSQDSRAAQQPRAGTFDSQVITGGARVASDVIHIYDPLRDFVDVTRHEAGHLVTKVAGDGPFSQIPSWLDEGVAVYSQNSPGGYEGAVRLAISSDQTLRLRLLSAPTNNPDQVNLFYGQSWSTVKFMIDTYGREKFATLFKTVKEGATIDDALMTVIGVDQDGLYNAWRVAHGLKAINFPPVVRATAIAAQPTRPPLSIPTSVVAAEPSGGSDPSASDAAPEAKGGAPATAIAIGAVSLLLAGGLGFLGMRLARRR